MKQHWAEGNRDLIYFTRLYVKTFAEVCDIRLQISTTFVHDCTSGLCPPPPKIGRALVAFCYNTTTLDFDPPPGGYNGLYGEAPPERNNLFRLTVCEMIEILPFAVPKKVGKTGIQVFKKASQNLLNRITEKLIHLEQFSVDCVS